MFEVLLVIECLLKRGDDVVDERSGAEEEGVYKDLEAAKATLPAEFKVVV